MPCLKQVIESVEPVGRGTPDDPARLIVRYYETNGVFLAEAEWSAVQARQAGARAEIPGG